MKDFITLSKVILDTLAPLTEAQLNDIITGQATLQIMYQKEAKTPKEPKPPKPSANDAGEIGEITEKLDAFQSTEEAKAYLSGLNVAKPKLKSIATHYGIPVRSKDTNAQIVDSIVGNVVGSKLRFDALLTTGLNK